MKAAVIGGGYAGLVTALGLTEIGRRIVCVEKNPERLATIQQGKAPFFEPGLAELFKRARAKALFSATDDLDTALDGADVAMIAVGTPTRDEGIDLTNLRRAAAEVGARLPRLNRYLVVAIKSTVVPGTTDGPVREEIERSSSMRLGDFGLSMNPEFLREGCAVADFLTPDRIVIGASDRRARDVMEKLYSGFDCPIVHTDLRNAEMIKYTSNALFACLISFSNEITRICERVKGLDEEAVMRGLHSDRRLWSPGANGERLQPGLISYLRGGVGFGGSCFPKDIRALERFAEGLGLRSELIAAIRTINEGRPAEVVDLLEANLNAPVAGLRIAVLGLAFKPDTDDTRESPGIRIAAELGRRGAHVIGHDPIVSGPLLALAGFPGLALASDLRSAMSGADGAIIATSWAEYRTADWPALTKAMARPLILDGRHVIPREQRGAGFVYVATGTTRAAALN